MSSNPSRFSVLAGAWGWFVGIGTVLLLIGLFAVAEAYLATIGAVWIFGAMLVFSGSGHLIHGFLRRTWSTALFEILLSVFYLVAGLTIIANPVPAAMILTLLLGFAFLISGLVRMILAITHREVSGWLMMLMGGLVSVLLGAFIVSRWLEASLFVIGIFVGIDLIAGGISWIMLGFGLRQLKQAMPVSAPPENEPAPSAP